MPMSEAQRKAASDRMKAMHAKKKETKETVTTSVRDEALEDLKRRVEEMSETNALLKAALLGGNMNQGVQVGNRGMTGTHTKFSVNPKDYPDPRERLSKETRLQRFAFPINYELTWDIKEVSYETIDGVRMREPRFEIELLRIAMDNDTGEPTDGRWVLRRLLLQEDPAAALTVAREQGLTVDEENEKDFLDEMRYLRIRQWLFDAFFAPKADNARSNLREMVVDGMLVPYFEVNSEKSASIPFSQLDKKL